MLSLITENGNHSAFKWAHGTASIILDSRGLQPSQMDAAQDLQMSVVKVLEIYYNVVIKREIDLLKHYTDQCEQPYAVEHFIDMALNDIHKLSEATPWHSLVTKPEWIEAAHDTIGSHLATAVHTERLLFCDANPYNTAAMAYRARFS